MFWPTEHFRLNVVLDDEILEDHIFGGNIMELARNLSLPHVKVVYEAPSSVYGTGYDRQQWSMFWADNHTTATYVGFVDTDTLFTTRVHPGDLFECDRPLVHGVIGQEIIHFDLPAKTTALALGASEVMRGMAYFPVILRVEHVARMREDISEQLGTKTFHDAFRILAHGTDKYHPTYSQFNIMVNYVFYHKHCEYSFAFEEFRAESQPLITSKWRTSCLGAILNELNTFPRVKVAEHLSYAAKRDKPVDEWLQEGFCRSTNDAALWTEFQVICSRYNRRELHDTLFQFEGRSWTWHSMCRKAQSRHYRAVWQEQIDWPSDLLGEVMVLTGHGSD